MTRSRRQQQPPLRRAPPASLDDAIVATKVAEAAVRAIRETAAEYGLDGPSWDEAVLHPQVIPIVARALRQSGWWWLGRAEEEPLPEPSHAKREPGDAVE